MDIHQFKIGYLKKGDRLSFEKIAKELGIDENSPTFRFKVRELAERIEAYFDYSVVVAERGKNLVVLLDEDVTPHSVKNSRRCLSGLRRQREILDRVDKRNLSPKQKQEHSRAVYVQSRVLEAVDETIEVIRVADSRKRQRSA